MNRKRLLTVTAAVVVVAAGAGTAVAYWTSTGSGAGTATVGTNSPFTVTVGAPVGAPLSPGGALDSISFTVKNANSTGNQTVGVATATVANPDGSAWTSVPGCSAADFAISGTSVAAADLAPGASTNGSLDIRMNNTASDQSGCKGASVPIYITIAPGTALTPQTITVTAPSTGAIGGSGTVSATGGGSPRPVSIVSSTTSVCTFSQTGANFSYAAGTVSYLTAGACVLTFNQAGTGTGGYAAAPTKTVTITVS